MRVVPRLKATRIDVAAIPSPVQGEQRPVTALRGVGAALAERLAKLGVTQVQDLLFVLPSRYEDRTHVESIGTLIPGSRVVVEGEVLLTEITFRRRRQMLCKISDGSGFLTLRFFYFPRRSRTAWRAAPASVVSARFGGVLSVWRSCIRSTEGSPTRLPQHSKRR